MTYGTISFWGFEQIRTVWTLFLWISAKNIIFGPNFTHIWSLIVRIRWNHHSNKKKPQMCEFAKIHETLNKVKQWKVFIFVNFHGIYMSLKYFWYFLFFSPPYSACTHHHHHTNSMSAISQLLQARFGPNFKGRFLGPSITDANCHGDICPGNICPGNIIHIKNIWAITDPISTKFFWPNFWGA